MSELDDPYQKHLEAGRLIPARRRAAAVLGPLTALVAVAQRGLHVFRSRPGSLPELDAIAEPEPDPALEAEQRAAVEAELEAERSLEQEPGKAVLSLSMGEGRKVNFAEIAHFAPPTVRGKEVYVLPPHIERLMKGPESYYEQLTYETTVRVDGWEDQVYALVESYLASNEAGAGLAEQLGIERLDALTPEQAVKLSLLVVRNLSKYSRNWQDKPDGYRADYMTTMDLLAEGLQHKGDPDAWRSWEGNGVCRNIASNVQVVFEALKARQGEGNMLRNTYCMYRVGDGIMVDPWGDQLQSYETHAWNMFITVMKSGSAMMTITDPTWALESTPGEALRHLDRTSTRASLEVARLLEDSTDVPSAVADIGRYYEYVLTQTKERHGALFGLNKAGRRIEEESVRRYLSVLSTAVKRSVDPTDERVRMPQAVAEAAIRSADGLSSAEKKTLYTLDQAGFTGVFDELVRQHLQAMPDRLAGYLYGADDAYMRHVLALVEPQQLLEFARTTKDLHARTTLRRLQPDALPPFNAEAGPPDMDYGELRYVAMQQSVPGTLEATNAAEIVAGARQALLAAAGGSQEAYDRVVGGRDAYGVVRDFEELSDTLRAVRTPA